MRHLARNAEADSLTAGTIRWGHGDMSGHVPLIGGDDVLGLLSNRLDAALDAQPNLVVLRGEAGIGKSRIAAALADRARDAGALVAVGHCTPVSGSELAFGPFMEMLTELARSTADLDALAGPGWQVVQSFLSSGEATTDPSYQDVALARSRLFAAVAQLLQSIAGRQPVVVVIEDLQW